MFSELADQGGTIFFNVIVCFHTPSNFVVSLKQAPQKLWPVLQTSMTEMFFYSKLTCS